MTREDAQTLSEKLTDNYRFTPTQLSRLLELADKARLASEEWRDAKGRENILKAATSSLAADNMLYERLGHHFHLKQGVNYEHTSLGDLRPIGINIKMTTPLLTTMLQIEETLLKICKEEANQGKTKVEGAIR